MQFARLRPLAALVLGLSLAACGGKAEFTVAGTLSGLFNDGLVLANGSDTVSPKANATTFAFAGSISYGTPYEVTIKTQPRHETCTVLNGKDTAGRFASINVQVSCTRNSYSLGGTVSGLTQGTLEITNGSTGGSGVLATNATSFTLPAVLDGTPYGVTVVTQPEGLFCTIQNGTGVMGEAAVTNIAITCVPRT